MDVELYVSSDIGDIYNVSVVMRGSRGVGTYSRSPYLLGSLIYYMTVQSVG